MSMFFSAVDEKIMVRGENNSKSFATTKQTLLDLFFALVRDLSDERLNELFIDAMNKAHFNVEAAADLFVLAFQTRNCRGGKGEKLLFYKLIIKLYDNFPDTVIKLVPLIPIFGYYKDYNLIIEYCISLSPDIVNEPDARKSISVEYHRLCNAIIDSMAEQLLKDKIELDKGIENPNISLISKFCPREKSHFGNGNNKRGILAPLVEKLFPGEFRSNKPRVAYSKYRHLISSLSNALDVTEIKMTGKRYAEIDFKKVSSLCANRCRKAFLNEKRNKNDVDLTNEEELTGNRYPNNPDRVTCRQNFGEIILKDKVKGKQLFPHELVTQLMNKSRISKMESDLYDSQWGSIRTGVLDSLKEKGSDVSIDLSKFVPLVDVSGSMSGIPMQVAIALGILVSEINQPAFRDRFITFHETPTWCNLSGITSLKGKVAKTQTAPWGGSTNFFVALDLICKVVEEYKLPASEVPDLIVFSDMQFNQAKGRSDATYHANIKQRFIEVGMKICGQPYSPPRIVYWNLRGNTLGVPVEDNEENVQLLSGFSPSMLKMLLDGDEVIEVETEDGVVVTKEVVTPYQTFKKVMNDKAYYSIRTILNESNEGILSSYNFVAPLEEPELAIKEMSVGV